MRGHDLHSGKGIVYNCKLYGDSKDILMGFVLMAFSSQKAIQYKIEDDTLYLAYSDYKAKERGLIPLPYPLDKDNGFDFIYNWLINVDRKKLSGSGQNLGFTIEHQDMGEYPISIRAHMIYYGK